eukprot:612632_1
MANTQQNRNWAVGNKFRNMGKNFQSSMKQTMNGFTGIDKPNSPQQRAYQRSATMQGMNNDTKSASGARQYQSGRRRSIDARTPSNANHGHYKSASITNMKAAAAKSASHTSKYVKRRKRSLLIGRESFNMNANAPAPSRATNTPKMPPNFYPPESFVNLLYRITEMESSSNKNVSRFGLAILDIDNLRGHIQSPLRKQGPSKLNKTMEAPRHSSKHKKLHQSMPQPRPKQTPNEYDEENIDEEEEDDSDDDDSMSGSASPLSTENIVIQSTRDDHDDTVIKYIDDQDLQSSKTVRKIPSQSVHEETKEHSADDDDSSDDEYGLSKIKPEPKSAAERTAAINHQRRKSSLLLRQEQTQMLQEYEAAKRRKRTQSDESVEKGGNYLAVGSSNMDPYLLFWNNSKKGESVVKVVQDIVLMSITKDIKATHFGFGEFAILANVSDESDLRRILKKILNRVSSNVATQSLGAVTLCGGMSMYNVARRSSISQWVNECRQACRLAKTNGRGRIGSYISPENRRKLAIELILEIKKPRADFSGSRVLELIRLGADLNFQYKYDTALMIAIKKKNEIALRYMIQYDYNPNVQDKKGRTALIVALERDCASIVLDLLVSKRDLNPRIRDYEGRTALNIALKKGFRDVAKTLILLGCEPLLGEKTVLNQWFMGAKCGNIDTIEMMLNTMSFPIDMIDSDDMTALMLSSANGHVQLVQYLLSRGSNVNIQGHRGYTALMFAIENGKIGVFAELIERRDILIGLEGDDGTTILMCAAKGAMPEIIAIGLNEDCAVDVNAQNAEGNTALMIAAQFDSVSVATELLRNHCDLDITNKKGRNALMICAQYGSSQIAAMLATLGSRIDVQDEAGRSALMYAAAKGETGIVVHLIKYGANLQLTDEDDMNALGHAKRNNKLQIVDMIENGTLQDVTDILQQMEILKQKNKALQKNMMQLNQINNELSDRINATELAKNQIQKKLHDTMFKMKTQFSAKSKSTSPTMKTMPQKTEMTSSQSESFRQKINAKAKMNEMRAGIGGMANKFNKIGHNLFGDAHGHSHAIHKPDHPPPKPPSKDIKL